MRLFRPLLALATLSFAVLAAGAGRTDPVVWYDPGKVTDLSFGVFCPSAPESRSEANDTIFGSVGRHRDNPTLLQQTQTIPALDMLRFGVILRYRPPSSEIVNLRIVHPLLGSGGKTTETWTSRWNSEEMTFHGYTLGLADGSPVGRWTLTGTRSGQPLFSVDFDVVPPTPSDRATQKQCQLKQVS